MRTLAELLGPSIGPLVARRDLLRASAKATDHDFDTACLNRELSQLNEDIARLEALTKATVSETTRCQDCTFHVMVDSKGEQYPFCRRETIGTFMRMIGDREWETPQPPNWCPLRTGPVLVTLRVP